MNECNFIDLIIDILFKLKIRVPNNKIAEFQSDLWFKIWQTALLILKRPVIKGVLNNKFFHELTYGSPLVFQIINERIPRDGESSESQKTQFLYAILPDARMKKRNDY